MAEVNSPVTRQIESNITRDGGSHPVDLHLRNVEDCFVYDRHGTSIPFKSLYQDRKSILVFVRNFLCYSCKEYVDDLSKIPKEILEDAKVSLVVIGQSAHRHIQPFCSLTGYAHEMYVDPERIIYRKLGMRREERFTVSAQASPHVKSGIFMGQMRSIWRAVTSPAFDFQGDLHQQGSQVHFSHFDTNHLDHMPINWLLQLAGVQRTLNFGNRAKVIHV
ncbi:peroxiredoxin-like 2C isoform X2 [Syngnathoides biaculeatus]|uniref:peroxiredoxin-like 2C isoform X2 n=1 Tax=Syngnathoides biaculeatus TaxID=300417 RepID=UPI002ADDCD74|nr:peroxiredoxin-like 2C isoform X2 [Syngnathoides biaculeatus]